MQGQSHSGLLISYRVPVPTRSWVTWESKSVLTRTRTKEEKEAVGLVFLRYFLCLICTFLRSCFLGDGHKSGEPPFIYPKPFLSITSLKRTAKSSLLVGLVTLSQLSGLNLTAGIQMSSVPCVIYLFCSPHYHPRHGVHTVISTCGMCLCDQGVLR